MGMTIPQIKLLSEVRSEKQNEEHENILFYLHLLGSLIQNAVACVFSEKARYPTWQSFIGRLLPNKTTPIQEVDKQLADAMETAKQLGHI